MTRPASDVLSLTLPARGRSRTRLRRPRKPSRDEVWCLFWTAGSVGFAVFDWLNGARLATAVMTVFAASQWRGFQRARRGVRPAIELELNLAFVVVGIAMFALSLARVVLP